jgi:hypothetical protein
MKTYVAPRWQDIAKWHESRLATLAHETAERLMVLMVPLGKLFTHKGLDLKEDGTFGHEGSTIRRFVTPERPAPQGVQVFRTKEGTFWWDKRRFEEYTTPYLRPDYIVEEILDPCPVRNASQGLKPDPTGYRITKGQDDEILATHAGWESAFKKREMVTDRPTYVGCYQFYRALALACDSVGLVKRVSLNMRFSPENNAFEKIPGWPDVPDDD